MPHLQELKNQLLKLLDGGEAHLTLDDAVKSLPPELLGKKPAGTPHSVWQLLEHMRIAQWDILEFSRDAKHVSPKWPEGYWPKAQTPPDSTTWTKSVARFRKDLNEIKNLLKKASEEQLHAPIAHGDGQTLLREILLVADHNAYHLGQLVSVRKMLEMQ